MHGRVSPQRRTAISRKPETIKLLSGPQFEMHKYWKWITVTIHSGRQWLGTLWTVTALCKCVPCLAHPSALDSSGFLNDAHNLFTRDKRDTFGLKRSISKLCIQEHSLSIYAQHSN